LRNIPGLTKTVAFVCIRYNDSLKPVGTAFFVGHMEKQQLKIYAVTARHVIEQVREHCACLSIFITYNGLSQREEREIPLEDWVFHPNQGADYIDVAVTRFDYDFTVDMPHAVNPHQIRSWRDDSLYGHRTDLIPNLHIPRLVVGEEVVIAGLFVHHFGLVKNIPIVRTGNLAAIPSDRIKTKLGSMEALLVEIRSIGGLSGSPVIGQLNRASPKIIGLIHGHFDQADKDLIDLGNDGPETAKINAGIAIVVPARFIEETLAPLVQADFGG
jgi:hypothetical protein